MRTLITATILIALCGTALAQPERALRHLEAADAELTDAEGLLDEYAAGDAEFSQKMREAKRKARNDTDRSRGPAALEKAFNGILGMGLGADILGLTSIVGAVGGVVYGKRKGRMQQNQQPAQGGAGHGGFRGPDGEGSGEFRERDSRAHGSRPVGERDPVAPLNANGNGTGGYSASANMSSEGLDIDAIRDASRRAKAVRAN